MSFRSVALATFVTVAATLSAHAATVTSHTFNLSKPSGYVPAGTNSFSLVEGDLTAQFTGGSVAGYGVGSDDRVSGFFSNDVELRRHNFGTGVCRTSFGGGTGSNCPDDEPHSVDGATGGIQDLVQMGFSSGGEDVSVRLTELTFGWIGTFNYWGTEYGYRNEDGSATNGAFDLIRNSFNDLAIGEDDTQVLSAIVSPISDDTRLTSELIGKITFSDYLSLSSEDLTSNVFGIKAGDGGSWKLLSATVEYDRGAPPPPPVVPLPAAGWLLLAGLGGLAWVGRRRPA